MIHPTLPTSECPIFADLKGAIVVLRNIAPMVTLAIEGFFGERVEINLPTVFSLVYILSGVALYVSTDVRTSPIGMAYMLLNMVSGVLERLLQRKMIALSPIDVSKTGMMLLNNAVSLILIVPLLFYFGEHKKWYQFRTLDEYGFALLVARRVCAIAHFFASLSPILVSSRSHPIPTSDFVSSRSHRTPLV
mmetsp:Transcript_24564/g.55916  ORF Transcript_24564/g.55916 Transcript_24564/m.55916 type:complete len:191 (-) Transcript_24564:560-1132(-)